MGRFLFASASFAMLSSLGVFAPTTSAFSPAVALVQTPASLYMDVLAAAPLVTKMVTGAALAVAGDALAQKCDTSATAYDKRRAASFAIFDMAYRALQHLVYPTIVAHFQGQYLSKAFLPAHAAAPLERTLCSQLGIVPLFYYPVFFSLTAALQGLGFAAGVNRARSMFGSLMQRNLLFWIPAQFVQFRWIPTPLQIPFVSVCGVFWTFVLSVLAGSAVKASKAKTAAAVGESTTCVLPEDQDYEIVDEREFEVVSKEFDEMKILQKLFRALWMRLSFLWVRRQKKRCNGKLHV
uniref:Peroxisomal membrane protein MPV17 n=2 Tax=Amphora coffeiformis TaxID=265554 RepID=A0A7S3P333_9STRA|mmetsp:Transcript_13003/g.26371  ORF Transcript_13003/g.26371 Transcript_13003/m.26371 type:complete len:294 (-) Transcript_13003:126-1007(-)